MGKFKELVTYKVTRSKEQEELEKTLERERRVCNMICAQYPFISEFVQQAFDWGDHDNVYDLIFSFELDVQPC